MLLFASHFARMLLAALLGAGLIFAPTGASAQSSLESVLPDGDLTPSEDKSTEESLPDPRQLGATWWAWLLDDDDLVDVDRARELTSHLASLIEPGPESDSRPAHQALSSLDQSLETIIQEFDTIPVEVSGDETPLESSPTTPETYTQFFEAVASKAKLAASISTHENQAELVRALQRQMDAAHNRLASRYRKIEGNEVALSDGLQLMASRAQLELTRRRMRSIEGELELLEQQHDGYKAAVDSADVTQIQDQSDPTRWAAPSPSRPVAPVTVSDLLVRGQAVAPVLAAAYQQLNQRRLNLLSHQYANDTGERPAPANVASDNAADPANLLRITLGQGEQILTAAEGMVSPGEAKDNELFINLRDELAKSRALLMLLDRSVKGEQGVTASAEAALVKAWTQVRTKLTWADNTLFTVNDTPVTTLSLVKVMCIIGAFWVLAGLTSKAFLRLRQRKKISSAGAYTLSRIVKYLLLTIGFLVAMSAVGIDLSKFALFISALGVGLGFGLQAIISNFVSGIIILFERSLRVGDFVELESGPTGKVRDINIRGTLVTTNDNIDILIPNSEFVSGRVTNWTLRDSNKRLRIPFGVAYGSDKETVKTAALEAAAAVPFTLDTPKTQVWLMAFGDSSLDFELVVWVSGDAVARPAAVQAAYVWALDTALREHNIEIPFPQQDLHVRSYFGLEGKDAVSAMVDPESAAEERQPADAPTDENRESATARDETTASENDAAKDAMEGIEEAKKEKRQREQEQQLGEQEGKKGEDNRSDHKDAA